MDAILRKSDPDEQRNVGNFLTTPEEPFGRRLVSMTGSGHHSKNNSGAEHNDNKVSSGKNSATDLNDLAHLAQQFQVPVRPLVPSRNASPILKSPQGSQRNLGSKPLPSPLWLKMAQKQSASAQRQIPQSFAAEFDPRDDGEYGSNDRDESYNPFMHELSKDPEEFKAINKPHQSNEHNSAHGTPNFQTIKTRKFDSSDHGYSANAHQEREGLHSNKGLFNIINSFGVPTASPPLNANLTINSKYTFQDVPIDKTAAFFISESHSKDISNNNPISEEETQSKEDMRTPAKNPNARADPQVDKAALNNFFDKIDGIHQKIKRLERKFTDYGDGSTNKRSNSARPQGEATPAPFLFTLENNARFNREADDFDPDSRAGMRHANLPSNLKNSTKDYRKQNSYDPEGPDASAKRQVVPINLNSLTTMLGDRSSNNYEANNYESNGNMQNYDTNKRSANLESKDSMGRLDSGHKRVVSGESSLVKNRYLHIEQASDRHIQDMSATSQKSDMNMNNANSGKKSKALTDRLPPRLPPMKTSPAHPYNTFTKVRESSCEVLNSSIQFQTTGSGRKRGLEDTGANFQQLVAQMKLAKQATEEAAKPVKTYTPVIKTSPSFNFDSEPTMNFNNPAVSTDVRYAQRTQRGRAQASFYGTQQNLRRC